MTTGRNRWLSGGAAAAGLVVVLSQAGISTAQQASAGTNVSTCNNPVLNRSLDEWGSIRGSAPVREAVADHQSARYAYVQPNNTVLDPSFYLPQQPVQPDERWTFGYDTAATRAGRARVEVDWYSTPAGDNSGYLGHANGSWTSLPGGAGWTRVAADFTAPPNAVRANVLTDHEYTATGALLRATACDYRIGPAGSASATPSAPTPPTPTEPTPTAPTPTEPGPTGPAPTTPAPPQGSTEAAVKFGWGAPQPISDEFSQPGPVDPRKWEVPDGNEGGTAGCWPGHQGNGRRCAKNNSVANGILTLTGEANGDTGWLEQKLDRRYGRWEIRSRSRNTGTSGGLYHVLHLIWPTSNNRFVDGEYDWVEYSNPDGQCLAAFLHYPKSPNDDKVHREHCPVDMTQWHNYAFEWTPKALVGYVDGVEWFRLTGGAGPGGRADIQAMPSGHLTIQLDNFTGDGGLRPAVFEVDWVRVYP